MIIVRLKRGLWLGCRGAHNVMFSIKTEFDCSVDKVCRYFSSAIEAASCT